MHILSALKNSGITLPAGLMQELEVMVNNIHTPGDFFLFMKIIKESLPSDSSFHAELFAAGCIGSVDSDLVPCTYCDCEYRKK